MMVANDRVEEYKAAGHKLAADLGTKSVKKVEPVKEEAEEPRETTRSVRRRK